VRIRGLKFILIVAAVCLTATAWFGGDLYVRWLHSGARTAIHDRRIDEAMRLLERARALDGSNAETCFLLARGSRLQGRLKNMRDYLEEASSCGYARDRLQLEQWMGMAQIGDLQLSESPLYDAMLESDEDSREICEALASGYLRTWQVQKAMVIVDGWILDYPDDPQPHLVKGRYFAGRGAWDSAVAAFESGLQIAPARRDIRVALADALRHEHRFEDAIRHLEKCLQDGVDSDSVLVGLGRCWFESGETEKALSYARRASVVNGDDAEVLHLLGQVEASQGNFAQALDPLRRAFQQRPYDPDVRYSFAMALRSSGHLEEAADHFRYVDEQQAAQSQMRKWLSELDKDPQQSELRCSIGRTLLQYGNPVEGVLWLRSVLQFDPENQNAREALAEHFRESREAGSSDADHSMSDTPSGNQDTRAEERVVVPTEASASVSET
jgi:type IV pilus assembly protein PilF